MRCVYYVPHGFGWSSTAKEVAMANEKVLVWGPLVRIFHWTLVVAFTIAYLTGEDAPPLHEWMGYLVLALVLARVVWGFIGSHHARFADFVRGPGPVLVNLRDIVLLRAKRYLGHSPAGGAMVVLLLAMLLATTVTGILAEQSENTHAAAAVVTTAMADENDRDEMDREGAGEEAETALVEAHEVLADLTLALVFLHIAGVILASFAHRENLIAAMFTGRKRA
jgi:cytochrome b